MLRFQYRLRLLGIMRPTRKYRGVCCQDKWDLVVSAERKLQPRIFSDYVKLTRKVFKPKSSQAATVLALKVRRYLEISKSKKNLSRNSGNPLIRSGKTVAKDKTKKIPQENLSSKLVTSRQSPELPDDDPISNIEKPHPEQLTDEPKTRQFSVAKHATFKVNKEKWDNLLSNNRKRRLIDSSWTDDMVLGLKEHNPYCCFIFKDHKVSKKCSRKKNVPEFTCFGECKFSTCKMTFSASMKTFNVSVKFAGEICHRTDEIQSRFIKGNQRALSKETMKLKSPRRHHLDCLAKLPKESVEAGLRDGAPPTNVLRVIRQEAKKRMKFSENEFMALEIMRNEGLGDGNTVVNGVVQGISVFPTSVILFSEKSLRIAGQRSKTDILYIDATGSIIQTREKPFYVYEICVRHPIKGRPPFAVATYVTESHNSPSIQHFLSVFNHAMKKLSGNAWMSRMIVCDGSMAIIKSVLSTFCCETMDAYSCRAVDICTGKATEKTLNKPILHICSSHVMKNFATLCHSTYVKQ